MTVTSTARRSLCSLLQEVPLFSGLASEALERLVEAGTTDTRPASDVLFEEGEDGDAMYVVLSGRLRIYHQDNPRRTLAVRRRGEFVGEIALIDGMPRTATVAAATRCKLFQLSRRDFQRLVEREPSIAIHVMEVVNRKVRGALEREKALTQQLQEQNEKLARLNQGLERIVERKTRDLRAANNRLRDLSLRDPLTGVFNRRRFQELLDQWIGSQAYLCLIMIDIDHFKGINDTHGHQAGDRVLIQVARTVEDCLGRGQALARYGGEEFAVLLSRARVGGARRKAEAIRQAVESQSFPLRGAQPGDVHVSLGVASYPDHATSGQDLIRAADMALYRAKETGRNRVVLWHPSMTG